MIKTKKDFLEMIEKSTLKFDHEKRELYRNYFTLYKATLSFCPDDFPLLPASSLDGWETIEQFEEFIRTSSKETVEERLKAVLTDLNTKAEEFIGDSNNKARVRNSVTALAYQNQAMQKKQKRNKRAFYTFITLFILFSVASAVFGLLENFKVIDFGGEIAGACGIFDFIVGAISVVYERIDDKRKSELSANTENATKTGDVTKLIPDYPPVVINPSNVVIINPQIKYEIVNYLQAKDGIQESLDKLNKLIDSVTNSLRKYKDESSKVFDATINNVLEAIGNRSDAATLEKAKILTDRFVECAQQEEVPIMEDENAGLLSLRWRIYCGALRNKYNDICTNKSTIFNAKEYRNSLLSVCPKTVSEKDLLSLEQEIKLCLHPDAESASNSADKLLADFKKELQDRGLQLDLDPYFSALRGEYNDIITNHAGTFSGPEIEAARAQLSPSLNSDEMKNLEKKILLVLRPDSELARKDADLLLERFKSERLL